MPEENKLVNIEFRIKYYCPHFKDIRYIREWNLETGKWISETKTYYAQPFTLQYARCLIKLVQKKFSGFKAKYKIEIYD